MNRLRRYLHSRPGYVNTAARLRPFVRNDLELMITHVRNSPRKV